MSDYTGFPEMMDGRVKTLHPKIHGGILADPTDPEHVADMEHHGIEPIDLVVVNLYPFTAAARKAGLSFDDLVEEIDIGGPSMVRAAAKKCTTQPAWPVTAPALPARPSMGMLPPGQIVSPRALMRCMTAVSTVYPVPG